jgi:hypothetical protein
MRTLRQIWNDIRNGENLDFYLLIAAIIGIFVLQLVQVNIGQVIPLVTLAALGILANSALRNRHTVEELSRKLVPSANSVFLEEFASNLKSDFESSPTVWLVGVSLSRTIRAYYSVLERKLRRGDTVRVLLVHPEGAASEIASSRPYPKMEVEQTQRYIRDSLNSLCSLAQSTSGKLEVRTIQNPLTYGVIATNPNAQDGVLYCELFPFQTVGNTLPRFILRAKDGQWYEFFRKELENLWNNGMDWQCDSKL